MGKITRIRESLKNEANNKLIEANVAEASGFKSDADNLRKIADQWGQLYEESAKDDK